MLKSFLAAIAVVLVLANIGSFKQGARDAWKSVTHWTYYPVRDMRKSVVVIPQHTVMLAPAAGAIPSVGAERTYGLEGIELATKLSETLTNPIAADDSSVARGERKFQRLCSPCHGRTLAGDGPVAALFMPPPDLLAEPTRQRKDGYIFSYIRHGGAVMPSYGPQTTAEEAWNVINYIRHMQSVSPR